MKTCQKCKITFPDEDTFCRYCGNALVTSQEKDSKYVGRKMAFEEKIRNTPSDIDLLLDYSRFLLEYQNYQEANLYCYKVLGIQENYIPALEILFQSQCLSGKNDDAIDTAKTILQFNPGNISLLLTLGDIAMEGKNYIQALDYYELVCQADPEHKEALKKKAISLTKLGKDAQAMIAWEEVYLLDTTDPLSRLYMGVKAVVIQNFPRAEELLEPVLEPFSRSDNKEAYFLCCLYLAYSYIQLKTHEEEVFRLNEKLIGLIQDVQLKDPYKFILAEINYSLGNTSLVFKQYEKAIELFSKTGEFGVKDKCRDGLALTYYEMGQEEWRLGNREKALLYLGKCIALCPDNAKYKQKHAEIAAIDNNRKFHFEKVGLLIFIFLLIVAAGTIVTLKIFAGKKESKAWEIAVRGNSAVSYQKFLSAFPNGKYAGDAKKMHEESLWQETKRSGRSADLILYESTYPAGKYIKAADSILSIIGSDSVIVQPKQGSSPLQGEEPMNLKAKMVPSTPEIVVASVSATGALKSGPERYGPENLVDGNPDTWWSPFPNRDGTAAWIKINFVNPVEINTLKIFNGAHRKDYPGYGNMYTLNNRLRSAILEFTDGSRVTINLDDINELQTRTFSTVITQSVKLKVRSVFEGVQWHDLCISEVSFSKQ